ncbi:hypothetical protein QWJ34_07270 [Saccharibacillus sp. CPCC 101409]|uniref:hypothetical protein n=1 Tax=Saccharibacillus sp. CPCC 101409 TaxID=3058041 RepID=UPI00267324F3|nr:hypothetical protein [Saccharibacillus sp. CPCC 101409]MDO3409560.1 hypothetical protein [Saccharibacillus sp. CPCC 101409]
MYTLTLVQILLTALMADIHILLGRMRRNLDPADPAESLRKQNRMRSANAYVLFFLSLILVVFLGFGWTFNFARPLSWLYIALILLAPAAAIAVAATSLL